MFGGTPVPRTIATRLFQPRCPSLTAGARTATLLCKQTHSHPRQWTAVSCRTFASMSTTKPTPTTSDNDEPIRLSKLVAQSNKLMLSRHEAERLIHGGLVTIAGAVVTTPGLLVTPSVVENSIKVHGKLLQTQTSHEARPRVWIVHKVMGEVVADQDPQGRPSLLERLTRGGVGKNLHLKAVGRLDMSTEGLILVTNDGGYKRQLELPSNQLHRTYRVRVHGRLTPYKLNAIRQGMTIEKLHYRGMIVQIESKKTTSTNTWLKLTCVEGKNRQIRKVLNHLGCTLICVVVVVLVVVSNHWYTYHSHPLAPFSTAVNVTRLIRISYGDYSLDTIPPGMALEVPIKPLDQHKKRGKLLTGGRTPPKPAPKRAATGEAPAAKVQWVRHS
jgi:23S rRNA pseudouridine2605 synthase